MSSDLIDQSVSQQIDAIIANTAGWHGQTLKELRDIILQADPAITEEVKWKKPSRPEGVPVWSCNGILCIGESLKNAVRLTFPKGTELEDPEKLFNTRLDSKLVRAIDFSQGNTIDSVALQDLIHQAIKANSAKFTG